MDTFTTMRSLEPFQFALRSIRTAIKALTIAWLFVRNDVWAVIFPGIVIGVSAILHADLLPYEWAGKLLRLVIYCSLFLGVHVLVSQVESVDEDAINKPWRPLPSGRVKRETAMMLRDLLLVSFPIWGLFCGVLVYALAWEAVVLAGAHSTLMKNFIMKSLYSSIATLIFVCACWKIITPLDSHVQISAAIMSIATLLAINVQDFRDVIGDGTSGRRTLPLVIGDRTARTLSAIVLLCLPVVTYHVAREPLSSLLSVIAWILPSICAAAAAVNLMLRRGSKNDHRSYRYLEYWYTLTFLSLAF